MLNRSPLRQNPTRPARNTSMRPWWRVRTASKIRHEKVRAAVASTPARVARAAPTGSTANAAPRAMPSRGVQPPNQYTTDPSREMASRARQVTVTTAAVATAAASATGRGHTGASRPGRPRPAGAARPAGPAGGPRSVPLRLEPLGVEGAVMLVGLDGQGQQ